MSADTKGQGMLKMDWDDAYANMAHILGSAQMPAQWAAEGAAYRASAVRIDCDIPYGETPREALDIVWPEGTPKGLAVFVHGGYWMRTSKSDWTQLAEGARAQGWAVALPGYTLTPDVRISRITRQIGAAITCAAGHVAGPIRLAGHSAGGHLVSRMICADTPLADPVADRIAHVLSISGVHDLRPLLRTQMNQTLHLDIEEARAESPALQEPRPGTRLTAWVGGAERPEFLRQTHILQQMWQGFDMQASSVVDGIHHHFSVIEGLKAPDSAICAAWLG